eukprot:Gb_08905 [translate_table: standard]
MYTAVICSTMIPFAYMHRKKFLPWKAIPNLSHGKRNKLRDSKLMSYNADESDQDKIARDLKMFLQDKWGSFGTHCKYRKMQSNNSPQGISFHKESPREKEVTTALFKHNLHKLRHAKRNDMHRKKHGKKELFESAAVENRMCISSM